MHKTLLFPTDFRVGSLNIVRSVVQELDSHETCSIILLHGYRLGTSITDLLFSSTADRLSELSNAEFEAACEVIRNKFESRITSMRTELFVGSNQAAFSNYLEAKGVSAIYLPQGHHLHLSHARSMDILPFIRRSGMLVNEVRMHRSDRQHEQGMVAEVFHDRMVLQ